MESVQVKPGYKVTELGMIPEDWELAPLEDFTSYISYGFTNPMPTVDSGIYMITAKDIMNGKIDFDSARSTTSDAYSKLLTEKSKPRKDDVLLTKDGTLGRLALVQDEKVCINQSVAVLRPNSKIDPLFFKLLLESPYYQKKMIEDAGGTTIKHIYITIVNKMLIAVPPKWEEQKASAAALSDVDALITAQEALIAKKRDIKTATMQELLTGKVRLGAFGQRAGASRGESEDGVPPGYQQTELGVIPEDWEIISFNKLADPKDSFSIIGGPFGSNLKSSDYTDSGVRIIQLQNIGDGYFVNDVEVFTSTHKANELLSCNIYPGDILLSKMGDPVARACIVPDFHDRYLMCSDGIRLKVNGSKFSTEFIYFQLNSKLFRSQAINASTGSTRQRIGLSDLKKLKLIQPPLPEQNAIAEVLSDMDAEITALEAQRDKTRAIKQGMMQELLTGKTRLL